jgi:xanthine/CO dehydrogenase XdhC/CoxF family maturation factor
VALVTAADPLRDVVLDSETAVVMMTHNFPLDLVLLPQILSRRPRYLGILGPRERAERLFAGLGVGQPAFVHAPAGLDAGCDSPEAIALSIVAEIQAETNSREGGKLKYRRDPIHFAAYEVGTPVREREAGALRPEYCETSVGSRG